MKKHFHKIGMGILILTAGVNVTQAQWASEVGFATIQRQCMKCHGKADNPKAVGIAALSEYSGEKIYQTLATGNTLHNSMALTDDDKRHVAESLSGRLLGSAEIGDAKLMPNRCSSNPPMSDPAVGRE